MIGTGEGEEDYPWDVEEGGETSMSPSPLQGNAFQIGIAFYKTTPVNPDAQKTPANPLARRGEKSGNFWKRWVEDPLIRHFAKGMKYKHCEIAFTKDLIGGKPIPEESVLAYGIIRGGKLFGKHRTFSSDQYEWMWINMAQEKCLEIQQFCAQQVGKPYDETAAKRSAFWPKQCDGEKWYCTDFVVVALQQGGIMLGKNPRSQTTDDVYDIMLQQGNQVERLSPHERSRSERMAADRTRSQDPSRTVHMERKK